MPRHRCNPQIERKLRQKLQRKEKKIKNLRHRLALKEKESKSRKKASNRQTYHESAYCLPNIVVKKSLKKLTTNKPLRAIRNNIKHLRREVKFLQKWYMQQVHEVSGFTPTRREQVLSELKRVRKLIFPGWNASMFAFGAASASQNLSESMNSFRDGLIVIGSTVDQMSQNKELENKKIAGKLKHLQRFKTSEHWGIYPLMSDVNLLTASLNATPTRSHLCGGTELRDKVASLVAGSEDSLCGTRKNQIGLTCRSAGFFTFVRRFLVRFIQTLDRLSSSGDSAFV